MTMPLRLTLLLLSSILLVHPLASAELWVAPDGADTNPGTSAEPLATLAAAQRKGRELRRLKDPSVETGVHIFLRDGVYTLKEPVRFRPEDSGVDASPTVIAAAPGERPVLSGGVALTGWRRADAPIAGLPTGAQGTVWVADTPVFNGRPLEFRQLWVSNHKATRARHPNADVMSRLVSWDREKQEAGLPLAALGGLRTPGDAEMFVQQQWEIAILRVQAIRTDGDRAVLTFHRPESPLEFEHPWPQPILPPEGGGAFLLTNALEFLDEPGEWYQDRLAGRIYYWPREGEDLTRDAVIAPALKTLVEISGTADRPVSHVRFEGISFQHTTWMRPSLAGHVPLQAGMHLVEAYRLRPKGTPDWRSLDNQAWIGRMPAGVVARHTRHLRFERCRFEHMAASGLDFVTGTHDDLVEGCIFRDLGGNGLQMGSFQEDAIETHLPYDPLDPREITQRGRIANNVVTDVANEDWGCVGILVGYGREIAIEHNEVFNVSYTAVSLGWGWTRTLNAMRNNRVHANHLHHLATRMCDTAGVYTLSAQPGTVVSENSIHSITMSPYVDRPDHWFYLYTDEGSAFITVRDNWCPEERFLENAIGPGNIWRNNGPMVPEEIKAAAGLQPAFRDLLPLP